MLRPSGEPTGAEFDAEWTLAFLTARAVPRAEAIAGGDYRRLVGSVEPVEWRIRFTATPPVAAARGVPATARARRIRSWFDLDRDLRPFQRLARASRLWSPLVRRRPGLRIPGRFDPFEIAVRAIAGQLISVAAATTIVGRLVAAFGCPAPAGPPGLDRVFPDAGALADVRPGRLRTLGLTGGKAAAIVALARAVASGDLDFAALALLPAAEVDRELCAFPGIGPWTAGYIRLRGLGDPDVALDTDLGIAAALEARGFPRRRHRAVLDGLRPWRSYGLLHLWAAPR